MASTALLRQSRNSHVCLSCRSFSKTARLLIIEPESPRYIEIPDPPQQTRKANPRLKGILPIPRNVLKKTPLQRIQAAKQALADYENPFAAPPSPSDPTDPRLAFKSALRKNRKASLDSSLWALHVRDRGRAVTAQQDSQIRRKARHAALHAPDRDDEIFTSTTLDESVRRELARLNSSSTNKALPDPDREERLQSIKEKLQNKEKQKIFKRRDALHTLYMNARDFIVDEEGLNRAIDAEFGSVENPDPKNWQTTPSEWAHGPPPGTMDLVAAVDDRVFAGKPRAEQYGNTAGLLFGRVTRIAEGVTGGKMNDMGEGFGQ